MTGEQKYNVILQSLAEVIESKNREINLLNWKVADLAAELKKVECEREAIKNEAKQLDKRVCELLEEKVYGVKAAEESKNESERVGA